MSEYGVEGPPEQETDIIKAKTRANDKWAQQGTHGPKGKVAGPTGRPDDLLVGRPARGPHRLKLDTWRKLIGCLSRFAKDQLQNGLPLAVAPSYKYKGGGRNNTHITPSQLTFLPWSLRPSS